MSVDLKSIKGEKLISNPAGSVRNLQPVAIFLISRLYAVVWTIKKYLMQTAQWQEFEKR